MEIMEYLEYKKTLNNLNLTGLLKEYKSLLRSEDERGSREIRDKITLVKNRVELLLIKEIGK